MSIVVYGSINTDLTAYTPELPRPGETLLGTSYMISLGGKGANQAVAAARLGADVHLVGHVGNDTFGHQALQKLAAYGVDVSRVDTLKDKDTGLGVISVADDGENSIVVIPGANMHFDQENVARCLELLEGAEVLLLQLEIPFAANLAVAHAAHEAGVKVILDPAPATQLPKEIYHITDIMTPNETETEILAGIKPSSPEEAAEAAHTLRARGLDIAVITLGAKGVVCASAYETIHLPAFQVDTVDTVASGDAFAGGMAVAISEGIPIGQALRWGAAAGALCATRSGAATAMPDRAEVTDLMNMAGVVLDPESRTSQT